MAPPAGDPGKTNKTHRKGTPGAGLEDDQNHSRKVWVAPGWCPKLAAPSISDSGQLASGKPAGPTKLHQGMVWEGETAGTRNLSSR